MMDQEFDKVEDEIEVEINTTATREHVGKIEQIIRSIKERACATVSDIPYKTLPNQVVIQMVYFCVMWMNIAPKNLAFHRHFTREK